MFLLIDSPASYSLSGTLFSAQTLHSIDASYLCIAHRHCTLGMCETYIGACIQLPANVPIPHPRRTRCHKSIHRLSCLLDIVYTSCVDAKEKGKSSGYTMMRPAGQATTYQLYCDQDSHGGGEE